MLPASNQGLGFNVGFPDVCTTPAAPSPVPVPYPNLGANAMSMPMTPNILISMCPGHNQSAKPAMTNGDNAGVAHAFFMQPGGNNMGNPKVLLSGMPAETLTNPCQGNNYNCSLDAKLVPSVTNVLMTWCPTGAATRGEALAEAAREVRDAAPASLGLTTGPRGGGRPGRLVLHARRGGLADRLGVRSGDVLLAVDDRPVDAAEDLPGFLPGETGRLTVSRGGRLRTLSGVRAGATPPARGRLLPDGVGLLAVDRCSLGMPAAAHREVERLRARGARSLVLDLRRNPGGALEAAAALAGLFLPPGRRVAALAPLRPGVAAEDHRGAVGAFTGVLAEDHRAAGGAFTDLPLAVLVDAGTASAAEVVAAALQDHGRAVVVGALTLGKGWGHGVALDAHGATGAPRGGLLLRPRGEPLAGRGVAPQRWTAAGSGLRLAHAALSEARP